MTGNTDDFAIRFIMRFFKITMVLSKKCGDILCFLFSKYCNNAGKQ